MRFTKIPLIATLMAVALSLLIVLPAIAQTTDITDGKRSAGSITVGVFGDIEDAQHVKLLRTTEHEEVAYIADPNYNPDAAAPTLVDGTRDQQGTNDEAYLADQRVSPQDTHFRNTLYVSNRVSAYNTVLINVKHDVPPIPTCVAGDEETASVTATVKNNRSGNSITLELVSTDQGDSPDSVNAADGQNAQTFFKVVTDGAEYDPTPDDAANNDAITFGKGDSEVDEHDGPTWCADTVAVDHDNDPGTDPVAPETVATSAVYSQADIAPNTPGQQAIATIFATHGDRLTVTTSGGSGQVELVVDGEGPEFSAVTPVDNSVTRGSRLTFSFEVRDDDSGLRHDGESVISPDGDLTEINPDGDQHLSSEPLSVDPNTAVPIRTARPRTSTSTSRPTTGALNLTTTTSARPARGGSAGSRAGVAYAFTASGADRDDGEYLYQVEATDRAGNTEMTDAESNTEKAEPYVFRVDDDASPTWST